MSRAPGRAMHRTFVGDLDQASLLHGIKNPPSISITRLKDISDVLGITTGFGVIDGDGPTHLSGHFF